MTSNSRISLYVGDLHPDVTEAMLFEKFTEIGTVVSIRVCRDIVSRRSLGYAYVNYEQSADAERALDILNYDAVKGRPMRIMWSQRDSSLRRNGTGNIIVKNISRDIDNKAFHAIFNTFDNILSAKIAMDDQGNSRGYGFVHFQTDEAAKKAIEKVNGMEVNGQKLIVERFMNREERMADMFERIKNFTNIYVKHFPEGFTEENLLALFIEFGKIASSKLMRNEKGESRGFAFIAMETHEAAVRAVESLHGKVIDGTPLYVARAQKKSERQAELRQQYENGNVEKYNPLCNLYIKNLDNSIDDRALRMAFSPFGNITSAKVMRGEGRSLGFGFVCYDKRESASQALKEMNGKILTAKPLYVAWAQGKEERKAHLAEKYKNRAEACAEYAAIYQPLTNLDSSTDQRYAVGNQEPATSYMMPNLYQRSYYQSYDYQQPMVGYSNMSRNVYTLGGQHYPIPPGHSVPQGLDGAYTPGLPQPSVFSPPSQQPVYYTQMPTEVAAGVKNVNGIQQPISFTSNQETKVLADMSEPSTSKVAPEEEKQLITDQLMAQIEPMYPDLVDRIIDLLMNINTNELFTLLKAKDALKPRVDEAAAIVQAQKVKPPAADGPKPTEK